MLKIKIKINITNYWNELMNYCFKASVYSTFNELAII